MRITHEEYFDPIVIDEDNPQTLVIENPVYFRRALYELFGQIDNGRGGFVLSDEKFNILPIEKNCLLITDLFNLDLSSKTIKTKINQEITVNMKDDEISTELVTLFNRFSILAENSVNYPIKVNEQVTLADLVKLLDVTIDLSDMSQIEQIIQFMQLSNRLLKTKLFITINLKDFFTEDEYKEFEKELKQNKLPLLMIERHTHEEMDNHQFTRIIDKDLCVL